MSSIYIHIPYCKQACTYCDFHFSTNQKLRGDLVEALCLEIATRKHEVKGPIETLYFGGGSPSILSNPELSQVFKALTKHFDLTRLQECTLETNPDDHSDEKLAHWKSLGVDRLSIGIQSFIEKDLHFMNRAHNASEAADCVWRARTHGFENITIDLIYGIPGQSHQQWQSNVQKAILLNPDHISSYCLSVEEKTALHHQVTKGLVAEKDDAIIEAEYLFLHRKLEDAGFEHYEISNFGKPGKRALHNANYWSGKSYLGLGPGAHSFDGANHRRWNKANNAIYIKSVNAQQIYWEEEHLDDRDKANEYLMTGLRKKEGVDLTSFSALHQTIIKTQLVALDQLLKTAVVLDGHQLKIDPERWLLADSVIRELMIEE